MTINKVEKLLEKATMILKQERASSRALHMQKDNFKELIMKLGVNPEDKVVLETLIEGSHTEIQELK